MSTSWRTKVRRQDDDIVCATSNSGTYTETVWSLSVVGVRNLSGCILSKGLLPRGVIRVENSANNGEILIILVSLIAMIAYGPASWYNLLEDQKIIKTIPWEVDLKPL